jgi:CRP/FNR family transcriptional regulator, cyclic AMP receptor protein
MEKRELLQRSPLFEMLSEAELEYVAELSRQRKLAAGETIFAEGDLGDALYVIAEGEVEVLRKDPTGQSKVIATLVAPEFFGEMSLIDKEDRSATIRVKTNCTLLQMTAENLTSFRKQHRDGFTFMVINIARVLSGRLREANFKLVQRL